MKHLFTYRCFGSVLILGLGLAGSFAFAAPMASPGAIAAQPDSAGRQQKHPSSKSSSGSSSFLTPRTARSQNLAAAEQEDDNSVYRHSAAVRTIGGWLHLDPEASARIFEYLNFAILAGAVLFFLGKYLPGMLRTRRETLQKQLVEARNATEQANRRLASVEERFARLDEEIAAIRAHAEQDSAAEEVRMKALIEKERQRIVHSAEQEIAAAASAAQRDLKRFAGELAVDRAAQMISLNEAGDRVLLRQFEQELSEQPRNGERN